MKKLLLIFSIFLLTTTQAQEIQWMSINDAVAAAKKEPRKIMIDFYAVWCAPCRMMDQQTYANPVIAEYINENFYPVKFNAEGNESVQFGDKSFSNPSYRETKGRGVQHEFARFMSIYSYPSTVFLDSDLAPITNLIGFFKPTEFEPYLALIATDAYKNIKTKDQWDEFQSKFKSKLKAEETL